MKDFRSLMVIMSVLVFSSAGCDLLNPPKKADKSQKATAQAKPVAAPAVTVVETPALKAEADQPLPAGVLARVGDWTISNDEFNERIKGVKEMVQDFNEKDVNAKGMLLNELVRQQLLIQAARREKLQDSKEVQAAIKEFENTLLVQEIVTRLTKDVAVSDDDVKKYYTDNPEEFRKPVEKQLREIVVAPEQEANDVLVQVLQGGDFAQMAKDKSKGKTKDNGGDLGYKTEASFPAMAVAVATLKKGGVSSVFEGPDGFYIVKVEDIRGGDTVSFDEVKADLQKFLKLRQQQQALADKVTEIQQEIKVKVNADLLKEGTGE